MTKTIEKEKLDGGFEELKSIIAYCVAEEWEFTMKNKDGKVTFEIGLFDGTIVLRNDGSWSYR